MNAPSCSLSPCVTVMAVDDEDTVLSLIVELLRNMGCTPVPATRGDSALALLEHTPQLDLRITDIRMPA